MLFNVTQLIALFLFIFLLATVISQKKIIKYILAFIGMAFLTVQISSVILGNSLLDYKYYAHINFLIFKNTSSFFIKELQYLIGFFLLLSLVNIFLIKYFSKQLYQKRVFIVFIILFCFGWMCVKPGIVYNIKLITELHFAKEKAFDEAIKNLDLQNYTAKENIKAVAGKNIVILILESIEAEFLNPQFAHLTPNLQKLASEMNYFEMKESEGGNFTTGAIYTYLTGFPCFFKNHGNSIFSNSNHIKINGISNALSKAGYQQLYLLGNPEFAGTGKMLKLLDIDVKSEKDYDPKYTINTWGLHDKDLFFLAKEELKKLKEEEEPFALYLSTISTHHPDGVVDERVVNDFPVQKSSLELMIAALDREIGQLVNYLESEHMMDNTALYIMSDHLLMGTASRILNDISHLERNLFVLTNAQTPSFKKNEMLYQIDIAKMILEGAKVQHNLVFLTDKISTDKEQFIEQNRKSFIQLNEASLSIFEEPKKPKKIKSQIKNANTLYIQSNSWDGDNWGVPSIIYLGNEEVTAKRGLNIIIYNEAQSNYKVEHFDTFENIEANEKLLAKLKELLEANRFFVMMIHDTADDLLQQYADELIALGLPKLSRMKNRKAYIAISDKGITSEVRKTKKVELSMPLKPVRTNRTISTIVNQATDRQRIIAHAGGAIDGITYTNCLEAMDLSYKKGFQLFELDLIKTKDGKFVAAHDWEAWKRESHYYGSIPPTEAEFLSYKIKKQYTPMNMDSINKWFANHTNAILVTDKVNDPEAFIPTFNFPGRLMMELFSFEAVEQAQALGVTDILLTENMWNHLGADKLKSLREKGIDKMAISRRTMEKNIAPYKALTEAGIQIYAFHVNFDDFKDESYLLREGLDFCYGFYADNWQFERYDKMNK